MSLSSVSERTASPTLRAASVRIHGRIGAAPERIFDAWLNAGEARAFLFAGRIGEAITAEIDARVGGRFRVVRHRDAEHVEYSGEYLEIERPHRLVFDLCVEKYAQRDDRVIVEFAAVEDASLIVLTHEFSLRSPADRSRIQGEWARALDALAELCGDGDPWGVARTHAATPPLPEIRATAVQR